MPNHLNREDGAGWFYARSSRWVQLDPTNFHLEEEVGTEQSTEENQGNRIINGLPAATRERVMAQMTRVSLKTGAVLFEPGEVITRVHFPLSGVISLVTLFADGNTVEVAAVGNEGIVGVPLRAGGRFTVRAISQVAGATLAMDVGTFLAESGSDGPLRALVQNYTLALFGQISQAVACNRLHSNEQRLSRWLLMSGDRLGEDEFAISHHVLGQMLGSSPATVNLTAGVLQTAGLINYRRGRVTIRDRAGLEKAACVCYGVIRELFESSASRSHPL